MTHNANPLDGNGVEALAPGLMVFLDGRNEHGTHVLPSLPVNLPLDAIDTLIDGDTAESIFTAAEAIGLKAGDHAWTEWAWNAPEYGEYGQIANAGWWEFRVVRRAPLASSHTAVEPVGELVERLRAQTTIHLTDLNAVRSYLDNDSILHHEAAAALVAAEKERDQLIAAVKLMEYSAGDAAHWRGLCDHAVARTEAAESEVATLKGRVAELEAGDRDANLALDFYASEAEAIVRHMQSGNTAALEAIMRVLSLDGGARARRLTSPEEKSNG